MNIGKVKTVFIVLFLIINIFLIYVSIDLKSENLKITQKEIETTKNVLKNYNVTMNENIIDSVYYNLNYVNIVNPVANKKDFAYTLTGSSFGSATNFNGKKGILSFKDNEFSFFPKSKGKKISSALPSQSAASKVLKTLSKYGLKTGYLKWQGSFLKDKFYEISFLTSYQGYEFFNSELKVLADKDGVYSVSGKYFEITGITKAENLKSPLEILINFAVSNKDFQNIHINNIQQGYFVNANSDNFTSLTANPCYKITLKNGNTVFYDAIEGNLIEYINYNS